MRGVLKIGVAHGPKAITMSDVEVYRVTPVKRKHYYAVLATRSYWDSEKPTSWGKGNHRYFAPPNHKRYMGEFVETRRDGYGDGGKCWEIYLKNGVFYELHLDYEGMTCLEETGPVLDDPQGAVPIDKNIKLTPKDDALYLQNE